MTKSKPRADNKSTEEILATIAALFVLFTALVNPVYSALLAMLFLVIYLVYKMKK